MKKTLLALTVSLLSSMSQADSATPESMTQAVFNRVIIADVQAAESAVSQLQSLLAAKVDKTMTRPAEIDKAFEALIREWKATQAIYVLGELNHEWIDTPRLMDTYHHGNEDLTAQLNRALTSKDAPNIALFKNSFKSINALAHFLYADNELTPTEREYASYTLTVLGKHLAEIHAAYQQHAEAFNANQDDAMSYLLNALIDSSYKLKEWRIGESAGLSRKYAGDPNNSRQEYPLSQNSLLAAKAILSTHEKLMGKQDYPNLGSEAEKAGATAEVAHIRQLIAQASQQFDVLIADKVTDFTDTRIKALFNVLNQLNDAYYQSLVKALPVQAKILDADGD